MPEPIAENIYQIARCPDCNAEMVKRDGRYGSFYSCVNYFKGCKGKRTEKDVEVYGTGVDFVRRDEEEMPVIVETKAMSDQTDDKDVECIETKNYPYLKFKFEKFNPVQSRVFGIYDKDVNFVIAAATSCGKTAMAEMIMAESRHRNKKALFLSPLKAVSQEKHDDWTDNSHGFLKQGVSIVTGDYALTESRVEELNNAGIVILTTEMLDSYPYETIVWCHKNDRVWRDCIGNIVENNINCDVLSYHKNKGVIPTKITDRIKVGERDVFLVEIVGGKSVEMTESHNLFIKGNNQQIKEVKLKDIKIGDTVAISNGFITSSKISEIDILSILKQLSVDKLRTVYLDGEITKQLYSLKTQELSKICPLGSVGEEEPTGTSRRRWYWENKGCVPLCRINYDYLNNNREKISGIRLYHSDFYMPPILNVTSEMAWFFGFYLAEGCVSGNHVMITQKNKESLVRCQKIFGGNIRKSKNGQGREYFYLDINNVLLGHVLKTFGEKAKVKKLPEYVFSWKKEDIVFFLDGFFEGDGSYGNRKIDDKKTKVVKRYHTSSYQLSLDLQDLLLIIDRPSTRSKTIGKKIFGGIERDYEMYMVIEWTKKTPWDKEKSFFKDVIFRKIKDIKYIGMKMVYDIEVQPAEYDYKIENFVGGNGGLILHNSRTRNVKSERNDWLLDANCCVVDESHLLCIKGRGDKLESALMRFTKQNPSCRIVLLSATMPNVKELAEWLTKLNGKKTELINSSYRPCKLTIHYETYLDRGGYKDQQLYKINKAMDLVKRYNDDKFILFVHDKNTGKLLLDMLSKDGINSEFHSADLKLKDRLRIEQEFKNRDKSSLRVLVATSTLAWGANLPARRVVILGLHRGMNEVEPLDIKQEVGRAGRVGFDPEGDAYILLPRGKKDYYQRWCENIPNITSTFNDPDILAFHIVSEIAAHEVYDIGTLVDWYNRSFAAFKGKMLDAVDAKALFDKLEKFYIVEKDGNKYKITVLGQIASYMYFSPYSIAGWCFNFNKVFEKGLHKDDRAIVWALANVFENGQGFVPKELVSEIKGYMDWCQSHGFKIGDKNAVVAISYLACLRNDFFDIGRKSQVKFDFDRISTALHAIDTRFAHWNQGNFFKILQTRVQYEVSGEQAVLCGLKGIGGVYARKLFDAGIKTPDDFKNKRNLAIKILGAKIFGKVMEENFNE